MNLRYRQSEPHPDSDAAHLGSSPHSCVGIMRRRVPHEHVAEGSAVGDGNADADGITICIAGVPGIEDGHGEQLPHL